MAERGRREGRRNRVRIVGGVHRGRLLEFPPLPGLRPTPDRVRETLFNWLQPILPGSACLDLFAGSGVLGLEAASRGAGSVLLLDRSMQAVSRIEANIKLLGLQRTKAEQADSLVWLQGPPRRYDVVFLDPPFVGDLLESACRLLEKGGWLRPGAYVYLERDHARPLPALPSSWRVVRQKKAGQVCYHLCVSETADKVVSVAAAGDCRLE